MAPFFLLEDSAARYSSRNFCRKSASSSLNFPLLGRLDIVVTGSCSWGESFVTAVAASSSGVDRVDSVDEMDMVKVKRCVSNNNKNTVLRGVG